jgi:small multidrug resistance pump
MLTAAWLLVFAAIAAEASAALLLRRSEGFQRLLPGTFALGAFGLAFYLVSLALVDLPVSVVYPVWAGGGTAAVALLGVAGLGERANPAKLAGIALVVIGMVLLNLAAPGA